MSTRGFAYEHAKTHRGTEAPSTTRLSAMARAEVQVKTLGQIAYEAFSAHAGADPRWADLPPIGHEAYSVAAQAVRLVVIEECAKEIYWKWASTHEAGDCADIIRALKDRP
jgi:hypothetical protein